MTFNSFIYDKKEIIIAKIKLLVDLGGFSLSFVKNYSIQTAE